MTREIPLTQGKIALIDDEDYERVVLHSWCAHKIKRNWYVVTCLGNSINITLHRYVLNLKKGEMCDHINNNGLDNRKNNLRIVTNSQNMMNQRKPRGGFSKYKGVSYYKPNKKWRARLMFNYKEISLGYFNDEVDAAKAYDEAALFYFGNYAKLNFEK